ncbi:hypothetical protein, partial [Veronia pacifica]
MGKLQGTGGSPFDNFRAFSSDKNNVSLDSSIDFQQDSNVKSVTGDSDGVLGTPAATPDRQIKGVHTPPNPNTRMKGVQLTGEMDKDYRSKVSEIDKNSPFDFIYSKKDTSSPYATNTISVNDEGLIKAFNINGDEELSEKLTQQYKDKNISVLKDELKNSLKNSLDDTENTNPIKDIAKKEAEKLIKNNGLDFKENKGLTDKEGNPLAPEDVDKRIKQLLEKMPEWMRKLYSDEKSLAFKKWLEDQGIVPKGTFPEVGNIA